MKKVVMYTGNPCPYCVYARALLDSKKIPYQEINVWEDESKRAEMLKKSGGRTSVPQILLVIITLVVTLNYKLLTKVAS